MKRLLKRIQDILWGGDDNEWKPPHCQTCTCDEVDDEYEEAYE